ncbi:unannotated protein [freshwater metagenome]|uniref:Unannotated protein n=1 Tax=freshwater metagenome TaxID=449393 RepID=A0A6J7G0Y0_9ZZZZ|nr:hypothetical protein [Actinomycetota bacterium]
MFKVVMKYPDGTTEEEDELFETEEEANEFGLTQCSNYSTGAETLHLSNPGDYPAPDDDEDVDYDVVEVTG